MLQGRICGSLQWSLIDFSAILQVLCIEATTAHFFLILLYKHVY
jgi:hypothetical protein